MNYDITFDSKNSNILLIKKDGKLINLILCPPVNKGCDIINFNETQHDGYNHNVGSLILITTDTERLLYHHGELIAKTLKTNKHNYKSQVIERLLRKMPLETMLYVDFTMADYDNWIDGEYFGDRDAINKRVAEILQIVEQWRGYGSDVIRNKK